MSETKKAISVYAEMTPNPEVMKFVVSDTINPHDAVEFQNQAAAKNAPLADQLFNFPFVKEVFIARNFLAITKTETVQWEMMAQQVRQYLTDYLQSDKPVLANDFTPCRQLGLKK